MRSVAAALSAMGLAAIVLTLFGALCMVTALNTFTWIWPVCCALVPAVLLGMRGIGLLISAREAGAAEGEQAASREATPGRSFAWILLVEFGLIAVAANVLAAMGLSDWILVAIAVLVGVHLLPLARLFRLSGYAWVGGAELAATATLAWVARGRITAADPVFGLVMALALWLTVLILLTQGSRLAASVTPAAPSA